MRRMRRLGCLLPYAGSRLVPNPRRCYGHTWRVVNMSLSRKCRWCGEERVRDDIQQDLGALYKQDPTAVENFTFSANL
ncbi:hypothetical protein B0H14DRAFT_1681806 [Mycena olivaceomarginata]|nr:hypothetical protein B0H14DRAFT_1681806 [Mycena olivaceomarginata]